MVLLDGQRLNEANTGSGLFANGLLTVDNIKQVEIIRGPGSALHGSNAFLGVINIITDREKNDIFVRGGTFTGNELDIKDIGVKYSEKFSDLSISGFARAFSDKGEIFQNVSDGIKTDDKTRDPREGIDLYAVIEFMELDVSLRYTRRDYSDFFFVGSLGDDIIDIRMENKFFRFSYIHCFS